MMPGRHLGGKGELALSILVCLAQIRAQRSNGCWQRSADTIAFGDAAVDVPMLRTCAINVAMGSGGEQARMAAAHVTDDVERDVLAKAFAHFGLI